MPCDFLGVLPGHYIYSRQKCVVKEHLAKQLEITDQLGYFPFGEFHQLFALAFIIINFCSIGWHRTALRNWSVTWWLLHSIAYFFFSFIACHTGRLGETMAIWRLDNGLGNQWDFFSSFFNLLRSFLVSSVHILFLNPNTWNLSTYISYLQEYGSNEDTKSIKIKPLNESKSRTHQHPNLSFAFLQVKFKSSSSKSMPQTVLHYSQS